MKGVSVAKDGFSRAPSFSSFDPAFGPAARSMNGGEKTEDSEYTIKGLDNFFIKSMKLLLTLMRAYPLMFFIVDITLSTSGVAVAFRLATPETGWGTLAMYAIYAVFSIGVSGAQMTYFYMRKNRDTVKFVYHAFLAFWLLDQVLDMMGYTYMTTQNAEWAMHIFPPLSEWSVGWGVVFVALWIMGFTAEYAMIHRIRVKEKIHFAMDKD